MSNYTGFSSKTSEQSGNYLDGVTITAKVSKTSTLDSDGIAVFRIANKDSQTLTVVASKEGYDSVTKVFSLSGLTVESATSDDDSGN